jgi:hypothetical protein
MITLWVIRVLALVLGFTYGQQWYWAVLAAMVLASTWNLKGYDYFA